MDAMVDLQVELANRRKEVTVCDKAVNSALSAGDTELINKMSSFRLVSANRVAKAATQLGEHLMFASAATGRTIQVKEDETLISFLALRCSGWSTMFDKGAEVGGHFWGEWGPQKDRWEVIVTP